LVVSRDSKDHIYRDLIECMQRLQRAKGSNDRAWNASSPSSSSPSSIFSFFFLHLREASPFDGSMIPGGSAADGSDEAEEEGEEAANPVEVLQRVNK
jgi:hypothetical protein